MKMTWTTIRTEYAGGETKGAAEEMHEEENYIITCDCFLIPFSSFAESALVLQQLQICDRLRIKIKVSCGNITPSFCLIQIIILILSYKFSLKPLINSRQSRLETLHSSLSTRSLSWPNFPQATFSINSSISTKAKFRHYSCP